MIGNEQVRLWLRKLTYILGIIYIGVFISLMVQVSHLADVINKMNQVNTNICRLTCGPNYAFEYDSNKCCTNSSYSVCMPKTVCRDTQLNILQGPFSEYLAYVIILSITGALIVFLLLCIQNKRRIQGRPVPIAAPRYPILHSNSYSDLINDPLSVELRTKDYVYQSFSHSDLENTCAVCIQTFNRQRAVKLKCEHIFHSKCIKDWSKMKKTCPLCRASQ